MLVETQVTSEIERLDVRPIRVLAADDCFPEERDEGEANTRCMPILVMKFDEGVWMHSHAVSRKGAKHPMADAMVQCGLSKITVQTDSGPAILELDRAGICLARESTAPQVVPEESIEYTSQTELRRKKAVQAAERKVRKLKFSVEELHVVMLADQPSSSCAARRVLKPDHESLVQVHC